MITEEVMGCEGILVEMPNANFLLIKGSRGYVMCGYLNMETAEKLGDAACTVTGVSTFDDVLKAKIKKTTSEARKLGVKEGMTGRQALEILR